jgi:hypothetical protein
MVLTTKQGVNKAHIADKLLQHFFVYAHPLKNLEVNMTTKDFTNSVHQLFH